MLIHPTEKPFLSSQANQTEHTSSVNNLSWILKNPYSEKTLAFYSYPVS